MVAAIMATGDLDPTVVVGGRVDAMGSNARLGKSQYLVAEADESDRSFLKLSPILAVVTNIDREHMDCYRNMRDVKRTFLEFMDRVPFYGTIVLCNDDALLRRLMPQVRRRVMTYGTRRGSDFHIKLAPSELNPGEHRPLSRFRVNYRGKDLGEFTLHVPGTHNVLNATAAIAVGVGLDVGLEHIRAALDDFRGVDRRFQLRGTSAGISVVDDYGHHPTEIRATLAAAKQCGYRKIHVIFQPHRYSRTQELMDDFAKAFRDADSLLVLDIYAASEQPIVGVTSKALTERIQELGNRPVRYIESFASAVEAVTDLAEEGDMILTLGAGNVYHLCPILLEKLQTREPATPWG
jgi:UDP-N-acetylmuramate--alanine ligase